MYQEDEYLPISGIQHFSFCRRQWALIHIEQRWEENLRTIEGKILHEKAHGEKLSEKRNGVLITRGMSVSSRELGITGVCDVVEFHKHDNGITIYGQEDKYLPVPVEYKRGKPKADKADELQLCAQSICLEEMLGCRINIGFMFYGETKHRHQVEFSDVLRKSVTDIVLQMHALYQRRHTPKVRTGSFCKACSLRNICLPKLCNEQNVADYIMSRMK